jgi:hypothetical protein
MGNVIPEMQTAAAVEKVVNGNYEAGILGNMTFDGGETATYTLNTTTPISGSQDGKIAVTAVGTLSFSPRLRSITSTDIVTGKWYKFSFDFKVNSGTCILSSISGLSTINYTMVGTGTYSGYMKATATTPPVLNFNGTNVFNAQIDNVSVQELGWANATEIYDTVYAATAGDATAKTYAALKESGMWAYHGATDPALGASYGKQFNGYAKKLLKLDLLSASFGWHIATEAELTTLAANGGNALKYTGTDFWTTTGGTNSTSFTALGGASRSGTDGTFATIKNTAVFGDDTGLKALTVNHDSNTVSVDTVDIRQGNSIRLIAN